MMVQMNNNKYLEHQTYPGPTRIRGTNSLNAYTDNKDSMHDPHTHISGQWERTVTFTPQLCTGNTNSQQMAYITSMQHWLECKQ